MPPRLTLPPAPAWLAGLALAFVLPGLAGHDPWKSLDALGIGIVYDMALGGDLLVPHVASWVWLNDAPLYYWVALAFGKLFQHFVEFHSAARLASGAFLLAACWLLYRGRATGLPRRRAAPPPQPRFWFSSARSASSCTRTRRCRSSPASPR